MQNNKLKQMPRKNTLNMIIREKQQFEPIKVVSLLLLIFMFAILFSKYAVYDKIAEVSHMQAEAVEAEKRLEILLAQNSDYVTVLAEYNSYVANIADDEEAGRVDRMQIMTLIEENLMNAAAVEAYSVVDNVISVKLSVNALDDVSAILQKLYELEIVSNIDVFTAGTINSDSRSSITMNIELVKLGGEQ